MRHHANPSDIQVEDHALLQKIVSTGKLNRTFRISSHVEKKKPSENSLFCLVAGKFQNVALISLISLHFVNSYRKADDKGETTGGFLVSTSRISSEYVSGIHSGIPPLSSSGMPSEIPSRVPLFVNLVIPS